MLVFRERGQNEKREKGLRQSLENEIYSDMTKETMVVNIMCKHKITLSEPKNAQIIW